MKKIKTTKDALYFLIYDIKRYQPQHEKVGKYYILLSWDGDILKFTSKQLIDKANEYIEDPTQIRRFQF